MHKIISSSIEIIEDKKSWETFLSEVDMYDFYHTFDYHTISKNENERPVLIKYTEDNKSIGLPLLIRDIPNSSYFDATSVYGYPGPVSKNIDSNFDNTNFVKEFELFLEEQNIISVFSRLNPYVGFQENILHGIGKIITLGDVVNIDITGDLETQRDSYQKRLKTHINKSKRNCTVINAESDEDVLKFVEIYYENMKRVGAIDFYFFSKKYFIDFFRSKNFKTEILLAKFKDTDEIIAGAMFVKVNSIVQYHLSGVKDDGLQYFPTKLLIDEMRVRAYAENYQYFNLGGGLNSKHDSLFQFKASFSKDYRSFKIWKYIVNHNVYNSLVSAEQEKTNSNYFPLYRSKP